MSSKLPVWCLQGVCQVYSDHFFCLPPFFQPLKAFAGALLWGLDPDFTAPSPAGDPVLNRAFGSDHSMGKDNYIRASVLFKTAKLNFGGLLTCQLLTWCAEVLHDFDALPFRLITCNRCGQKGTQNPIWYFAKCQDCILAITKTSELFGARILVGCL